MKSEYSKYYFLEDYLFSEVTNNFKKHKYLTPEEFFCIIIWKANRAKSKIKKKILERRGNLGNNIKRLTEKIYNTKNNKEKLKILLEEWNFSLPMATAILTVLYPDDFSVYDIRVRNQLDIKDFSGRKDEIEKYFNEFLPVVKKQLGKSLRDKDRYLWGKDFYNALVKFIKSK